MKFAHIFAVLFFFCFFSLNSYSQIGITSYSVYALGVNANQDHKISFELKAFANRDMEDLMLEFAPFYNFKSSTYHQFSVGAGLNVQPFTGDDIVYAITIPGQLQIWPLQDFKRLSLVFELAPEFVVDNDVNLRSFWGIRYAFGNP